MPRWSKSLGSGLSGSSRRARVGVELLSAGGASWRGSGCCIEQASWTPLARTLTSLTGLCSRSASPGPPSD
eukprot:15434319-Alexandrium_andersonii.AAC.1